MMVYLDPMDDIYLGFHSISTCKKPHTLNGVCCIADFWQLFEWSSQDFPLISQDNSL